MSSESVVFSSCPHGISDSCVKRLKTKAVPSQHSNFSLSVIHLSILFLSFFGSDSCTSLLQCRFYVAHFDTNISIWKNGVSLHSDKLSFYFLNVLLDFTEFVIKSAAQSRTSMPKYDPKP